MIEVKTISGNLVSDFDRKLAVALNNGYEIIGNIRIYNGVHCVTVKKGEKD